MESEEWKNNEKWRMKKNKKWKKMKVKNEKIDMKKRIKNKK